jgi:MULE transposase domain
VLGLDGTHLKSRFKGILLSATRVDAKGSLFPVSYAVVDAENDQNWAWFVECLQIVIQQHAPAYLTPGKLMFLSDRQTGQADEVVD